MERAEEEEEKVFKEFFLIVSIEKEGKTGCVLFLL